jgi:hypothetical protein
MRKRQFLFFIFLGGRAGVIPSRTTDFAEFVRKVKGKEYQAMHPAKLTFQALRIHLNEEFAQLEKGMRAALKTLAVGGKLGIITWKHSESIHELTSPELYQLQQQVIRKCRGHGVPVGL